jgi:hypothetical protein
MPSRHERNGFVENLRHVRNGILSASRYTGFRASAPVGVACVGVGMVFRPSYSLRGGNAAVAGGTGRAGIRLRCQKARCPEAPQTGHHLCRALL